MATTPLWECGPFLIMLEDCYRLSALKPRGSTEFPFKEQLAQWKTDLLDSSVV